MKSSKRGPNARGQTVHRFVLKDLESNTVVFQGCLKPTVCKFEECKRDSTLHNEYCTEHLRSVLKVEIKPALNPAMGLGLFAVGERDEVVFAPRGNKFKVPFHIVDYKGQRISSEELLERYGALSSPFAMHLTSQTVIDASLVRGVAAYINHAPQKSANCKFTSDRTKVSVVATRTIRGGEELMVNYNVTRDATSYRGFFTESTAFEMQEVPRSKIARVYCYCQKPKDDQVYLKCLGRDKCWFSHGLVHTKCARKYGEVNDPFTCRDCAPEQESVAPPLGVLCEVRDSLIPGAGLGLFTTTRLKKNTVVTWYDGKPVSRELALVHPNPTHLMSVTHDLILDGLRKVSRNCGGVSFANHCARGSNAKIKRLESNQCVLITTRDVEGGEELLYNYGRSYWVRQRDAHVEKFGNTLCYCLKPDTGELYVWCKGGKQCINGAWVHAKCAGEDLDLNEPFTCRQCVSVL